MNFIVKKIISIFTIIAIFISLSPMAKAEEISISAVSAILIDASSGRVIYSKNSEEQRAMASTTKIMTAILTLESGDLDKAFTVDDYAIQVEGTSMGLKVGDIVTRRNLVEGMLLPSGNDAANAAAVSVSGSIPDFVKLMNEKAKTLGLINTSFATPSGLDAENHYSTASDLAKLTRYALSNGDFANICSQSNLKTKFGNPPSERWLKNSNKMLHLYSGAIGVKTGFTDDARRCLVSAATRDGVTLIAVTLNAPDDWNDHTKMLNLGFNQLEQLTVDLELSQLEIPVVGSNQKLMKVTAETAFLTVIKERKTQVRTKILVPPFLYSGINQGDKIGTVQFIHDDIVVGEADLLALYNAEEIEKKPNLWDRIKDFFGVG